MVSVEAKARILKRRVEALQLPAGTVQEVERIIQAEGLKLPGAAEALRVEWLNDMVAHDSSAEFGHAARNPAQHFIEWARLRARKRFHVTYRSVDTVERRLGTDVASRMAMVVWPQEIAWAQRMRLDRNPLVATKAALFLREAEGQPGKTFEKIADIFADAFLTSDYTDHPVHSMSPAEIRLADTVPEFTPLFLRHAARAYADKLRGMSREMLAKLASVAARDEQEDRDTEAGRQSAAIAQASPMRRMLAVISAAISAGIKPNDLHDLERVFLLLLERGSVKVEIGTGSPHQYFITEITNPVRRNGMLLAAAPRGAGEDPDSLAWQVVNLRQGWLKSLPESFQRMAPRLGPAMEAWQVDIAEERREAPLDPVSDFGFFLLKDWSER